MITIALFDFSQTFLTFASLRVESSFVPLRVAYIDFVFNVLDRCYIINIIMA